MGEQREGDWAYFTHQLFALQLAHAGHGLGQFEHQLSTEQQVVLSVERPQHMLQHITATFVHATLQRKDEIGERRVILFVSATEWLHGQKEHMSVWDIGSSYSLMLQRSQSSYLHALRVVRLYWRVRREWKSALNCLSANRWKWNIIVSRCFRSSVMYIVVSDSKTSSHSTCIPGELVTSSMHA